MSVTSLHHLEWRDLLCTNLMSLHKKAALCDTRLRMSDSDCDLLAHGCVLTAASPVLMSQLERSSDHLCLPRDLNYPCHVWRCLLQFIYSGTVTLASTSQAAEVLEAAETLELHMLVYLCEFYMQHEGVAVEVAINPPHTNWLSEGSVEVNTTEPGFDNKVHNSKAGANEHNSARKCPDDVISKCSVISCSQSANKRESSKTLRPDHDQSLTLQNKLKVQEITEKKAIVSLPDDQCMDTGSCDETELKSPAEVNGGQGHDDVKSRQKVHVNPMVDAEQASVKTRLSPTSSKPSTRAGEEKSAITTQTQSKARGRGKTTKPPLMCPQCGRMFAHPSVLLIHSRRHTGEKPFVCLVCGQTFSQSGALKSHHQRTHTNHKPYECVKCGKSFSQKSDVQAHQRVHTRMRPYTCPECGKAFARPTDLACHKRCHMVIKMFTCGTCGRGFSQRCALRCHERVHTGERPYACGVCDRAFSSARALKKHACKHNTT